MPVVFISGEWVVLSRLDISDELRIKIEESVSQLKTVSSFDHMRFLTLLISVDIAYCSGWLFLFINSLCSLFVIKLIIFCYSFT